MAVRSDGEIKAAVFDELTWDSRVTATDIGVSVHQRTVTLTGKVSTYAERLAAEAAARRLHGVFDVVNEIMVGISKVDLPTDTEITQAARRTLARDLPTQADRIAITVSDG
ncbi:MAG TPA: BON domain-containing protein, partial [Chloroflexota bacterium]|nr:BON domain-containing protein [Chloroflexota bacterium]